MNPKTAYHQAIQHLKWQPLWWGGSDDARVFHGIEVRAVVLWQQAPAADYVSAVGESLDLLAAAAPGWIERCRELFRGVFVTEALLGPIGRWARAPRLCLLNPRYVIGPDASRPALATTVVHEAMHAWIEKHGITYPSHQVRIERLCYEAQLAVAKRLGTGDTVRSAASYLSSLTRVHSPRSMEQAWINDMERVSVPRWLRVVLDRKVRHARRAVKSLPGQIPEQAQDTAHSKR